VPCTDDGECLEPAQPDLDLDVIHDGFPSSCIGAFG
jgi:hypothetical protein